MTLNMDDLGIKSKPPESEKPAEPTEGRRGPTALIPGSTVARALFSVWSGNEVTIVNSPPGAGKSTLIAEVIGQLLMRGSGMSLTLCAPTRVAAMDLTRRLVTEAEHHGGKFAVRLRMKDATVPGALAVGESSGDKEVIEVRTVASAGMGSTKCDLLIVDEAYQTTYADILAAAETAEQVLLVGDPGQIGPVIQGNTRAFERLRNAPHMRAPEVFAGYDGAVVLSLDNTYRLGAQGAEAVRPLYDFDFGTGRVPRHVEVKGKALPEIIATKIPVPTSPYDMNMLATVARIVRGYLGGEYVVEGDNPSGKTITGTDIAVVAAHKIQVTTLTAMLNDEGLVGVTVGTADVLQGGQWPVVIALDPMTGYEVAGSHQSSLGRLCVMASRHMAHLRWVHDGRAEDGFRASERLDPRDIEAAIATRAVLRRYETTMG